MRKLPWISWTLLVVAYACFGWALSSPEISSPTWLPSTCQEFFNALRGVFTANEARSACHLAARENFLGGVLAVLWVLLISFAYMSPLTSFSSFVTRWFKSDTVAFLTLCVIAGMVTFILFWLQVFLYITVILATEALARIDIQTLGFSKFHAFWILVLLSLVGLALGWGLRLVF